MDVREIKILEVSAGHAPFEQWYDSIVDSTVRLKIFASITRLANPGYRNYKSVGSGVHELRIFYGAGYRVYFGVKGKNLVVLLGGGDKNSQKEDINEAKKLWKIYKDEVKKHQRKFPGC